MSEIQKRPKFIGTFLSFKCIFQGLYDCFWVKIFCFSHKKIFRLPDLWWIQSKLSYFQAVIYLIGQNLVGQNISLDKIFDTKLKFRHFCPTNFCPIRYFYPVYYTWEISKQYKFVNILSVATELRVFLQGLGDLRRGTSGDLLEATLTALLLSKICDFCIKRCLKKFYSHT